MCTLVLASRIPFLFAGYGSEEDSWGIILAVKNTFATGVYEASRLPGHPVQEIFYLIAPSAGPVFYNGMSALMSVICVLFFALILKKLRVENYIYAAAALAFTPVFYISSTYTIDYVWALAFVMISFYFILKGRFIIAGLLLGLAIGCRITSGAMLLPFFFLFFLKTDRVFSLKQFFILAVTSIISGVAFYIPAYYVYDWNFFTFYDQFPYPPITKVLYKMTIGVFGLLGFCTLLFYGLKLFFKKKQNSMLDNSLRKRILWMSITALLLYTFSYLRLPQKSGYLVPIIPFVILIFAMNLSNTVFKIFCSLITLSSFIFGINLTDKFRGSEHSSLSFKFTISGQEIFFDPLTGSVFSDYSKRKNKMIFTQKVISDVSQLKSNSIIIAGWWYNEIFVELQNKNLDYSSKFAFYMKENEMRKYKSNDFNIFYLPEQNIYNDQYSKISITDSLALPFYKDL